MAKKSSSRYQINNGEWNGKTERYVARAPFDLAAENPNRLYVLRGFQTDRKTLEDPNHPQNTIYLDGACQGPYQDVARHVFSLDHHAECYRSITIASCEQALRLTRKKIIGATGFNVIANDPDPDTVLAAWQILNADRMAFDKSFFNRIRPFVNLEGNIDAHGFGHEEFLDFAEERKLKAKGLWEKTDLAEYVRRAFGNLDKLVHYDEEMREEVRIDAFDEIPLSDDKNFVCVVSSSGTAFDVEKEIHKRERRKKRKCVCMLFHDGRTKFTLKLSGFMSEFHLRPVYEKLTYAESNAKLSSGVIDQRFTKSGWGGSDEIGGAPRYPNGAGPYLGINTIKKIVEEELKRQVEENKVRQAKAKNGNGHSNGNGGPKPPTDPIK